MLSTSHIIIIVIGAIILLGPDKIPNFLQSIAEGLVLFKNTLNNQNINKKPQKTYSKKKKTSNQKKKPIQKKTNK